MKIAFWALVSGVLVWLGVATSHAVLSPLHTAFQATGAKPVGYSVNAWVELPPGSQTNLTGVLRQVVHEARIQGPSVTSKGPGWTRLSVAMPQSGGFESRAIVEHLQNGTTYVVLDRVGSQGFQDLNGGVAEYMSVLKHFGATPHLFVTLEGTIAGAWSGQEASTLVSHALHAVAAHPVTTDTQSRLVSVAGYTALIPQSDQVEGHAVNVQVAATYDGTHHQTDVYVGTPLISIPY